MMSPYAVAFFDYPLARREEGNSIGAHHFEHRAWKRWLPASGNHLLAGFN